MSEDRINGAGIFSISRVLAIRTITAGLVLIAGLAAAIRPLPAHAAPACPPWIKESNPIQTHTTYGASLEKEYWTNPQGVWFKVPFAYFRSGLDTWPSQHKEELLSTRNPSNSVPEGFNGNATAIGFGFWIPDLRPPSRTWSSFTSYQPCEDGRPKPTDEQFIVKATIHWPWLDNPPKQYVPGFVQKNITNRLKGKMKTTRKHGLLEVIHLNSKAPFFYLHNLPGTSPEFALRCRTDLEKLPNPSCNGRIWWPEEKLGARVNFSRRNIEDWKAIMAGIHTLAHRWRNKAIEELKVWETNDGK